MCKLLIEWLKAHAEEKNLKIDIKHLIEWLTQHAEENKKIDLTLFIDWLAQQRRSRKVQSAPWKGDFDLELPARLPGLRHPALDTLALMQLTQISD